MNEREILEKSIEEHQAAINAAQKDLANLGKPKLRHGDYGYWLGSSKSFIVDLSKKQIHLLWVDGDLRTNWFQDDGLIKKIEPLGNIFDDLKRKERQNEGS